MMNKKAQISTLTKIALSILVFIVVGAILLRLYGGVGTSGKQAAGNVDDYDGDGVINIVDSCPCYKEGGDIKNDGCSLNYKIKGDKKGLEDRSCLSKLA